MRIGDREQNDFIKYVISSSLLEEAIDWIGANMPPECVFSSEQLTEWAQDNYISETEEEFENGI